MRVKLVTMIRIDGATARIVISPISCTARSVSVVLSPKLTEMSCAWARAGKRMLKAVIAASSSPRAARPCLGVALAPDPGEAPDPAARCSVCASAAIGIAVS